MLVYEETVNKSDIEYEIPLDFEDGKFYVKLFYPERFITLTINPEEFKKMVDRWLDYVI